MLPVEEFRARDEEVPQDWPRLAAHLARHGMELDLARPPHQFKGGLANLGYLVRVDGVERVLRRPPPGPLPPGAHDMAREYRVLSRLWERFPAAPRAHHFCAHAGVLGAPFLIMQYRPGLVIRGRLPAGVRSEQAGPPLSAMLVRLLAELHAVDAAAIGLDGLGKPQGFVGRAVEGWAKRGDLALADEPSPAAREVVAWLRAKTPADGQATLLHCDFKLDNVILDPASLEPRAVVDWDMATRGDPLFDVATLASYWTEPGDPPCLQALEQMPTTLPGFWSRSEMVEAYAEATGRDVSAYPFHRVLTLFKLGVVFLQLHARYRAGGTSDARYAGFGALGRQIIDHTHDVMRGRAS